MTFFSFLLLLLAQTPQGPAQTTTKPAPTKESIEWSAQRPLTWMDFKSKPTAADRLAALTSGTIDVQVGCTDFVFKSTVRAVFIPQESWVRDASKASAVLLRHEQLHFDITELHARMLRQKLSSVKLNCQHLNPAFNNLTKAAFSAWQREEARYDQETNHGLNAEKQKFWEDQIQVRLTQLVAFAQ